MPDLGDLLFGTLVNELKNLNWEGVRGDTQLQNIEAGTGLELRGPWIRFRFDEDGQRREVRGWFHASGRETVKLDGHNVEQDDVRLQLRDPGVIVSFSGIREVGGRLFSFNYVFTGKT